MTRLSPDEKIRKAKRLLAEARRELRRQAKERIDASICECGHRRDEHGAPHSINYTGGVCFVKRCRCMNYLSARVGVDAEALAIVGDTEEP